MRLFSQAIGRLNRVASSAAGVLTGLICIIVCYGVVARYIFNRPVGWSEELSAYLMVWAAFAGAAYTLQRDAHIGVEVICKKLPERHQRWLHVGKCAVGVAFCGLLAWKGYESCSLSWKLGRVSVGDLPIPLFIPQMAVPVGAVLLGLQMLEKMAAHLSALGRGGKPHP